jgi:hypothetical protein
MLCMHNKEVIFGVKCRFWVKKLLCSVCSFEWAAGNDRDAIYSVSQRKIIC